MTPSGRGAAAALLALVAACGDAEDTGKAPEPQGLVVTLQSEDAIDGRRPELTLSCNAGRASFWLEISGAAELSQGPINGALKTDDGAPVRIQFTHLGEEMWAPRLDEGQEQALVRTMAAARNIYFTGPEGRTDRVIRWDLGRLGDSAARLRDACAPTPGPP